MSFTGAEVAWLAGLGLIAGALGGLLGIGGSVVMIPGMAMILHRLGPEAQHLFQASAMAVNVAVAAPSAWTHRRRGSVPGRLFRAMFPAAAGAIIVGVLLSNLVPGLTLKRLFAGFLIALAAMDIVKWARGRGKAGGAADAAASGEKQPSRAGTAAVGVVMGGAAGLLGIGGGVIAVPLARRFVGIPLRECIGLSSAVMCLTAAVGAGVKIPTLGQHGFSPMTALTMSALLAPTAVVGALAGARLMHRLPTSALHVLLVGLLLVSAWQMLGL